MTHLRPVPEPPDDLPRRPFSRAERRRHALRRFWDRITNYSPRRAAARRQARRAYPATTQVPDLPPDPNEPQP